jgi:hypothetical protein
VIAILIPTLHATKFQRVKLHKVEDAGLWIESQAVTDRMLQNQNVTMSPMTGILRFPLGPHDLVTPPTRLT